MIDQTLDGYIYVNLYLRKEGDRLTSYLLMFAEGILTFVSPCILPMIPVYLIYLAGAGSNNDTAAPKPGKTRLLTNALGFVLGFTIVFVLLGATATALGQFLESNRAILQKISGIIIVIFGLNYIGLIKISFLNTEKRLPFKINSMNFLTSVLFGFIFSFSWTPCLSSFLGPALLLAGNSETIAEGIFLLLIYSIGLGIPFILSAIIFDKARSAFSLLQRHGNVIRIVSGILLIITGVLVFTDLMKYLI